MYNGFDEDSQVLPRLSGLVSLEADTQPRRAGIIERNLEHKLLFPVLRNDAWPTGHVVLLKGRERIMWVEWVSHR